MTFPYILNDNWVQAVYSYVSVLSNDWSYESLAFSFIHKHLLIEMLMVSRFLLFIFDLCGLICCTMLIRSFSLFSCIQVYQSLVQAFQSLFFEFMHKMMTATYMNIENWNCLLHSLILIICEVFILMQAFLCMQMRFMCRILNDQVEVDQPLFLLLY